ncbi:MAG: thioredoxin [Chloroflexi bacterium]|nr:thioredoxin [Chloroflexota bacterium]
MAGIAVGEASFGEDVLQASHERPVVVDFWAAWCGPCRILGPMLEAVSEEYGDSIRLVTVDVDQNPALAQRYGISGIPAVKAFRNGEPVNEFVGALPEPQVRAFFASLVPTAADHAAAAAASAHAAGEPLEARRLFDEALAADPRNEAAALGLAELLIESGAPAELERARQLAAGFGALPRARRVEALARLQASGPMLEEGDLLARIAADGEDAEAHYGLGMLLAARGEWEAALEELLATVRLDRTLDDDGGRRTMLDIFAILGNRHALSEEYRRRLAAIIF